MLIMQKRASFFGATQDVILTMFLNIYSFFLKVKRFIYPAGNKELSALILPPADPGSLGDEALVNATFSHLKKLGAKKIGVVSYKNTPKWKNIKPDETIEMEDFFKNNSLKSNFKFLSAISHYEILYCLGADVLDGFYNKFHSIQRIKMLDMAVMTGAKSTALGFSFNAKPDPDTVETLSKLSSKVRLCARESISQKRLIRLLKRPIELVADVAFLLQPKESKITKKVSAWINEQHGKGRIVIGLNTNYKLVNELKSKNISDLINVFQNTIKTLYSKNKKFSFVLIPHDFRQIKSEINDDTLADKIFKALPRNIALNSIKIPSPFSAAEIKSICSNMDLVLSGRMHLAIACLGQETPVACITYQGKFEGLFKYFNLKGMAINPEQSIKLGNLVKFLMPLIKKREKIQKQIRLKLPYVLQLAKKNFI